MAMKNEKFSVLTLNIWGLPWPISKAKSLRLMAIGKYLSSEEYDLVCLQELWCHSDFLMLKKVLENVLPHSHFYHSGVFGSGLCIFSKWPILKTFFTTWNVNGYFHMVHHGDWFGGKGVAFAQLKVNDLNINVYNTHLIAKYSEDDCYRAHRAVQAFDTAQFIDLTSQGADLSIVCGDFNSTPTNICYRLIKMLGKLEDAYIPQIENEIEEVGTNECKWNKFTGKGNAVGNNGSRIDYILFRSGPSFRAEVLQYLMPLSMEIPDSNINYSDHEAIAAVIYLKKHEGPDLIEGNKSNDEDDNNGSLLEEAFRACSCGEKKANSSFKKYVTFTIVFLVLIFSLLYFFPFVAFFLYFIFLPLTMYFIFMATIWHKQEMNGILATKTKIQALSKKHFT